MHITACLVIVKSKRRNLRKMMMTRATLTRRVKAKREAVMLKQSVKVPTLQCFKRKQ